MTTPTADATAEDRISAVQSIEDAVSAASSLDGSGRIGFTLSTGVVLRLKSVPPLAIREASLSIRPPAIPTVYMEDKGREEENANDPDYLQAMNRYALEQLFRVSDVLMLLGTSIVGEVPEGVFGPDSDEWMEPLEALGIALPENVRTNKHVRYLAWLRLYAVRSEQEVAYLMGRIASLSGVTEVEVQRAAAAFRDRS